MYEKLANLRDICPKNYQNARANFYDIFSKN